ncbi:MAG: ferredoxin family protein [Planctomycetaceae bacterium]|nr:ferredoxin family protein [Planctomycetaceae bacterium]
MANKKILLCLCSNAHSLDERALSTMRQALTGGEGVAIVDDLCLQAADRKPLPAVDVLLACSDRALRWLARFAGTPLAENTTTIDLASPESLPAALQACEVQATDPASATDETLPAAPQDWTGWYPVIDYDRCSDCKQCMNFCLFGVYSLGDDGRVAVSKPRNCKLNCPACARVCPQGAIIFPKHSSPQINGRAQGSAAGANLNDLLKGDAYEALRRRSVTAEQLQQAMNERKACACDCNCSGGGNCACSDPDAPESDCGCDCDCHDSK